MKKIAVIGTGAMGSRIAQRLIAGGYEVLVWNRTKERAGSLLERGAAWRQTPAQAAREADGVITMVADPAALEAVSEGAEGIAAGAGPHTTVLEMSTVGPQAVGRLRSVLPPETGLLDAPVLGSLSEAEAGTLKIFAGGPEALFLAWRPVLETLGTPLRVGDLGAGAAAKLVANGTLFTVLGALGEALQLAQALGLSREAAFEILAQTPLAAQAERRRPVIEHDALPTRFRLSLARKDADLIAAAADEASADLRMQQAARSWLTQAEAAGKGGGDYAAVLIEILGAQRA